MTGTAGLEKDLSAALAALLASTRPMLLLGPEAEPAVLPLLQVAEWLGAAVFTTPDAKSLVDHSQSCGTFSFGASRSARRIAREADVVLAVSALGEFTCRLGEAFREQRLVQVTDTNANVGRSTKPAVALVDPSVAVVVVRLTAALMASLPAPRIPWFTTCASDIREDVSPVAQEGCIQPIAAMAAVQAALPESARVCLDVTSGALHAYERLKVTRAQRVFSSIESSACMGEALLASLGIRIASGEPTLTIVGDWGFCMAPAELHTAVELSLGRYVVLIWANSGGGLIGAGVEQQRIAVPEAVWRWREPPDFGRVARGYRARGVTVRAADTLQAELERALADQVPVVIEAKIDPRAAVPAGDRFLTLGEAPR